MINVYDPLFKIDNNDYKTPLTDVEITEQVKNIANRMGYSNVIMGKNDNLESIKTMLDTYLYKSGVSIVIPIPNEKVTINNSVKELGKELTAYNLSFVVINQLNNDSDFSSYLDKSVTTEDGNVKSDTNIVNALKSNKLWEFRLYRNDKDIYPIVLKNVLGIYYGYKSTQETEETSKTIKEIEIEIFNNCVFYLKNQVFNYSNIGDYEKLPILPTNPNENVVNSNGNIKSIGSDNSFNTNITSLGFVMNDLFNQNCLFCHLTSNIYILTNES